MLLYDISTRIKSGNIRNQTNVGNKLDESTKKNNWQNKNRIRRQQIRESCCIQFIDEWRDRRREWDEYVTRTVTERLVKISRDNIRTCRKKIFGTSEKNMERFIA